MPVEAKPLFRPDVLQPRLAGFLLPERVENCRPHLARWADLVASNRADQFKEQELLPDFLTDIFCGVLGYTRAVDNKDRFTLSREKHVEVDGKFADAVLGDFQPGHEQFMVAVEGKGPKDPLDRPFAGRRMSAVDQGYRYAINLPCDWIIVTSIRQTRLYHKGSDQHTYERFDTEDLAKDAALLKKFVFLLIAERVVSSAGQCHLHDLLRASDKVGRELTKEFYVRYANMREEAFDYLCRANPQVSPHEILGCTQQLLDQILFCAFCEDRGLLPPDTIQKAYAHSDPYNPRPIWDNFRGLFRAVNVGNPALSIPAYNGGLFADNPQLLSLTVPDEVCASFKDLAGYDYRPAYEAAVTAESEVSTKLIDVDILGHIFEQSITDLERLRNELDGLSERLGRDQHATRRKKEGAFYTPAFITRYIIEQALGRVLIDRFQRLRLAHAEAAEGTAKQALADPRVYDLNALNRPQRAALVRFWEAWQEELATLRVLDPACGSGAFLIEAFDQLHTAYQRSNDRLAEVRGHRTLFDLDRHILQHNLYGVDLNEEAVQICRLSLWIKTAQPGKVLTSLDHTIRVGNSVVDDPAVHARAFNWRAAFPEVWQADGFDVVVSNPPYIRQEWLAPYKPYWERAFESYHGVADIFTYFFELAVRLLRDGGRVGFITSGSWVRSNFGGPLRQFLAQNTGVESMVDFGEFQPFQDAEMIRPSITLLHKRSPGGPMRLFKWLTAGRPPENLSDVIASAPTMGTERLGAEAWELDPDEVIALRQKLTRGGQPLKSFGSGICRGVTTGLNEVFVIPEAVRARLCAEDPRSAEIIKPFVQGTHLRPWYIEASGEFLIFTRRGIEIEEYPEVLAYLEAHRNQLEPKPADWPSSRSWPGRKPGTYRWYEIQDTVDYWAGFEQPKIVWPDISKLPRFSMDTQGRYLGNTAYIAPGGDYYLLGVLASWATWFFISKTAQPLRLRANRWQYRLIAQYMEEMPIPPAGDADRRAVATLAERCCCLGTERYEVQVKVQQRLLEAFGCKTGGVLNTKAQAWWDLSLRELGTALKASFKLPSNPLMNPRTADEWEPYLDEKRQAVVRLSGSLEEIEAELNDRIYRLFSLTAEEVKLLQKEVEH